MTKRTPDIERRERDFYPTPPEAIKPLLPHLPPMTFYDEPFCGDGAVIRALSPHGHFCSFASDLEPHGVGHKIDVFDRMHCGGSMFITNSPWPAKFKKGEPTISMIQHLTRFASVWILLSADFWHNKYFDRIGAYCTDIVSVGRVSWMMNGKGGLDNCSWYRFDTEPSDTHRFHWRT